MCSHGLSYYEWRLDTTEIKNPMLQLHKNLNDIPENAKGCVLAIGNFDGVHLGHRALLKQAQSLAQQAGALLGVLTFEPHPREFFQPAGEPFRLTLLPAKQRLLGEIGVDHLFAANFDQSFAALEAEEFTDRILKEQLGARHVVVGEDFAFGKGREGTVDTLRQAEKSGLFSLTVLAPVANAQKETYSSSAVRALLRQAKFEEAAAMLGSDFQFEADVIHGDKRGRTLGYPTANQDIPRYVRLPFGVYAVRALVEGEQEWRDGAANFGIRPMFKKEQPVLETFILDFAQEIYGKILRVKPVSFLRPEKKFENIMILQEQIKQDCVAAKAVLKSSRL